MAAASFDEARMSRALAGLAPRPGPSATAVARQESPAPDPEPAGVGGGTGEAQAGSLGECRPWSRPDMARRAGTTCCLPYDRPV
jgi:hypothetical protein